MPAPYMGMSRYDSFIGLSSHTYLDIGDVLKWFVSQTPYLIHEGSIAPHITSSGVLFEVDSLSIRLL